jgi:hypothetical protein
MLQKAASVFSIPSSEIKDRPEMKWKWKYWNCLGIFIKWNRDYMTMIQEAVKREKGRPSKQWWQLLKWI